MRFFYRIEDWLDAMRSADIQVGSKIHGAIAKPKPNLSLSLTLTLTLTLTRTRTRTLTLTLTLTRSARAARRAHCWLVTTPMISLWPREAPHQYTGSTTPSRRSAA